MNLHWQGNMMRLAWMSDFQKLKKIIFPSLPIASHDAFQHSTSFPSSFLRRLVERLLLASVAVLPALHQDHQGVEPEEDDHWDQDPLDDDPN